MSNNRPVNILLADNSATIRKVVEIIFSGDEYVLRLVKNGAEALQAASESVPDVMLIDMMMLDMDGYQFCEQARQKPALARVPILLMSGSFDPFDEERARNSGATDFINKPFESRQLIDKVQELYAQALAQQADTPDSQLANPFQDEQAADTAAELATEPETAFPFGQDRDDPWGAFSVEDTDEEIAGPAALGTAETENEPCITESSFELELPDVLNMLQDEEVTATESAAGKAEGWAAADYQSYIFETELETEPPVIEPPVQETVAALPVEAVTATPAPAVTQEQLQEALSAISAEIVEKIVREIVPPLAEKLIRAEIAKITGQTEDEEESI